MHEGSNFIAVDVETANSDLASICSIGAVEFVAGKAADEFYAVVNPEDRFDRVNSSIHGIDEDAIAEAPLLPDVLPWLIERARLVPIVSHTHFDRSSLRRAAAKYGIDLSSVAWWLDSARIVRRAWPDRFGRRGYGLASVAAQLGIEFQHHNALEDARAAGEVTLKAVEHSGISIEEWKTYSLGPIPCCVDEPRVGVATDPNGPLAGEVVVFTGSLSMARKEAIAIAEGAGMIVRTSVTKKTTMLVVGQQDLYRLKGQKISSKHRRALELAQSGQSLRIYDDQSFQCLLHDGLREVQTGRDGTEEDARSKMVPQRGTEFDEDRARSKGEAEPAVHVTPSEGSPVEYSELTRSPVFFETIRKWFSQ